MGRRGPATALVALALAFTFSAGLLLGRRVDEPGAVETAPVGAVQRTGDVPGPPDTVVDGELAFRLVAQRCGMVSVQGDHADWLADGRYCRMRLRVEHTGRFQTQYRAALQVLQTTAGPFRADLNAVQVGDQPVTLDLRRDMAVEFDVWFDIPQHARVTALELHAAEGSPGARISVACRDFNRGG